MALEFLRPGSRVDRIALFLFFPLLFVLVFVALSTTLVTTVRVEGDSMMPGLTPGDRLLVRRSYDAPVRGDLIVFTGESGPAVIKRVIGLPGDVVEMRDGHAIINGSPERDGYQLLLAEGDLSHGAYTVPEDSYYVAGDNRPRSLDSRVYGAVPKDRVVGEAVFLYWPLDRLGRVDRAGVSD